MPPVKYAYKAFLSYSHAADGRLAPAVQAALHGFARPWYRLRALRVFRDRTSLSANPGLWAEIHKALEQSEFLLLLASPSSASSKWVRQELAYWLESRDPAKLIVLLTDGALAWDEAAGDFDWAKTTALPDTLRGKFRQEPLYVDLTFAKGGGPLSTRNPEFLDRVATVAAALHGRPKDEIFGDDVRQHRRTRQVAWAAVAVLTGLLVVASWLGVVARTQRNEARASLARQYVKNGATHLAKGDYPGAMLWFAEASDLEPDDRLHRLRLTLALQTHPRLLQVWQNDDDVRVATFSPDGRRVLTAGDDGVARVWDVDTGELALPPLRAATGAVRQTAFSHDGRRILTVGFPKFDYWHGRVVVWDAADGRVVTVIDDPKRKIGEAAFVSAGDQIVTVGIEEGVRLWAADTGKAREAALARGGLFKVSVSPDGRSLAVLGGGSVEVFDAVTGKASYPKLSNGRDLGGLYTSRFSPDSKRILTAGGDQTLYIWDAMTGQRVGEPISLESDIGALAFSGGGNVLAMATNWDRAKDRKGVVAVSGWPTMEIRHSHPQRQNRFRHLELSHDGHHILTVYDGVGTVDHPEPAVAELRDLTSDPPAVRSFYSLDAATLSPDGSMLLTAHAGNSVRLWSLRNGLRETWSRPHAKDGLQPTLSPDGKTLLTRGARDGTCQLWDAASGRDVGEPWGRDEDLAAIEAFSTDGSRICTIASHKTQEKSSAWAHETSTARIVGSPTFGPRVMDLELSVEWSADGRFVAWVDGSGELNIYEIATGVRPGPDQPRGGRKPSLGKMAFSPDGSRFVFIADDGRAEVRAVSTGLAVGPPLDVGRDTANRGVSFSPDGKRLLTTHTSGIFQTWDIAAGGKIGVPMGHPRSRSHGLKTTFSPDGRRILSTGGEAVGGAQLWDAATGRPVTEPFHTRSSGGKLKYSPDGTMLLSHEGVAFDLYDAESGLPVATGFRVGLRFLGAAFEATGQRIVVLCDGYKSAAEARVFHVDLTPAAGPIDHYRQLAQALSNRRIDATGTLIPLGQEELGLAWRTVRQHRDSFGRSD